MAEDPFLTPAEAADVLRVSTETIRRAINAGRLEAFADGRVIRIRRSQLDAYIASRTGQPRVGRRRTGRASRVEGAGR